MEFPGINRIRPLHILVIVFVLCGLLFPAGHVVIAQDIPPVEETGEAPAGTGGQPPADNPPVDTPVEDTPTVDATADPVLPQVPAPTDDPVVTEPPAAPVEQTPLPDPSIVPPADEIPAPVDTPAETPVEIIAAAADLGVSLVDGEGEPLVMADEETSELLTSGDPYYISSYGIRRLNGTWQTLPVYEAYAKVAGGCIPSTSNYTVNCNVSANPIQEAINAASTLGRVVHIEAGDYSMDNLVISTAVTFRTTSDIVVNQITLNSGANVDFFNAGMLRTGTIRNTILPFYQSFSGSRTLTSSNIFLNEGALLSDAVELVSNGGKINISAGTFNEEAGISINKSVEIEGQGAGNTIITPNEALVPLQSLLIINANDVVIHDLTLNGRNPGGSNDVDALTGIRNTDSYDGLEVYNTTISDFFMYGIQIGANSSFNIHDNTFENIQGIPGIQMASGIRVASNHSEAGTGIIENNLFSGNDYGVSLQDSNILLTGNNFTGNLNGLRIDDLDAGDTVTMRYNRFSGNTTGVEYNNNNSNDPVVNSTLDWWGCNGGPGMEECDSISGSLFSVPSYLMFGLSADPTSVYTGETSGLTAFMYSGGDPLNVVDNGNLPWFTAPAPSLTGTVFGTLEGNTFTGGDITGTQEFLAMFDNATATTTVDVLGDSDGDRVEDGEDVCPGLNNPDQVDSDEDGMGDECDPTPDGDSDEDEVDNLEDNCPEVWNPDQSDSDNDGIGDACDIPSNGNPTPPPGGGPGGPVGGLPGLIPVTGGLGMLSCTEAATLSLPGGDRVVFSDPLCDYEAAFSQEAEDSLLTPLPDGLKFLSAVNLSLQKDGSVLGATPSPVTFTLSFIVPEGYQGKTLSLFMWDPTANGGVGGWTALTVEIGEDGMAEAKGLSITGFYVLAFQ